MALRDSIRRKLLLALGFLCVGLAAVGLVLPIVPTTPLLLAAAACFSRSSRRFHDWLLGSRLFGPIIRDWEEHRSVSLRTKVLTVILVGVAGGISAFFFIRSIWLRVALGIFLVALAIIICSLPTTGRRVARSPAPSPRDP